MEWLAVSEDELSEAEEHEKVVDDGELKLKAVVDRRWWPVG